VRFKALDGWRGLCALSVALMHLTFAGNYQDVQFVNNAYLFVDFFFVLSGFVISHSTWGKLSSIQKLANFVVRRFARLWPLHVTVIAILVFIEAARAYLISVSYYSPEILGFEGQFSIVSLWENLLFLNSIGLQNHITWNFPSWSIGAEFMTYLIFAACAYFAWKKLIFLAAGLAATGLVFVVLLAPGSTGPTIGATYDYGIFRCIYGFFLGHLTYQVWQAVPCRFGTAAELLTTIAVIAFVQMVNEGALTLAAPLVFAVTVWVFAAEGGFISDALKTKPIQKLGLWSYGIYMTHILVVVGIEKLTGFAEKRAGLHMSFVELYTHEGGIIRLLMIGSPWVMDVLAVGYLAVVIALGALAYRFVEVPGQNLIRRLVERRSFATVALARQS
jgi:peptidoglycan/LPS O-acetylase OafA/YrhL